MSAPAHLTPKVSNRGFRHLPSITDAHFRTVKVYESSAASGPHIWLSLDSDDDPAVHLTVEQAHQLADQLTWLADHHYQAEQAEADDYDPDDELQP